MTHAALTGQLGGSLGETFLDGAAQSALYAAIAYAKQGAPQVTQESAAEQQGGGGATSGSSGESSGGSGAQSTDEAGKRSTAKLVSRSIGGEYGSTSSEQHLGLVITDNSGDTPSEYLVQGGPTADNHLRGGAESVGNGVDTFSHSAGADWSNPSKVVDLKVTEIGTYTIDGDVSPARLNDIAEGLNKQYSNTPYNYSSGPNSNTYIRQFMGQLGLSTNISFPVTVKGW
jgi:hypothetical protein